MMCTCRHRWITLRNYV